MATESVASRSTAFKIAWGILLGIAVLATASHLMLSAVMPGETTLFLGWAAYTGYAAVVLAIPFRRREAWAWYTSWILVIGFASLIFFDAAVGVWYLGAAAVMAVSLLLVRPAFFQPASRPRGGA
jgi:hypothetical protein